MPQDRLARWHCEGYTGRLKRVEHIHAYWHSFLVYAPGFVRSLLCAPGHSASAAEIERSG